VTPHPHTDDMLGMATLYALGALTPGQAATFEAHLGVGCLVCQKELEATAATASALGYAAPPARPRAELRERLLSRIQTEGIVPPAVKGSSAAEPSPGETHWTIVGPIQGTWEATEVEGMRCKLLFREQTMGRTTALVHMEGGVNYPPHRHTDSEELYLLEGDLTVGGQALRPGDYCAATTGSVHGRAHSVNGCTFILVTSTPEEIADTEVIAGSPAGLVIVHASEGIWRDGPSAGVAVKRLFIDPARGTMTALVRMQAGARLPPHRHVTTEQLYMLEGDGHVAGHVLGPGDYYHIAAGSIHDVTSTDNGCIFLLISSRAEILS
jgi:quercetin dioxygenase-like cupin family protein